MRQEVVEEFQKLTRFEKLAKEYFPQIWEFFEMLEETTLTSFHQTGPTASTGEEERPVTITNFHQTGPTASTGKEERPVTTVTNFHQTICTASTGKEERPVTTITNFDQTVCATSTEEEERPVTAVTNFDQTVCTARTEEEETIDRLIEEVYQSKDTIFNIVDILAEIYDLQFFFFLLYF